MSATTSKEDLITKLRQLPSLPVVVQEVIASFNVDNPDATALANKIAQDQGLSARVLRVANSTFYGLPRKVGSIQDAIAVLGFDCLRSLVLSAVVAQVFPVAQGSLFDRPAYWQRSFRVAAIAQSLAKHYKQDPQLAFTAGMFHDMGQLVLDMCITQQFSRLLRQQAESGLGLLEVERSELGFDHAEIGAEIVRRWNFPQEIEQVVRHCQQPASATTFSALVCVVHTAILLESGIGGAALIARLSQTGCAQMQTSWDNIEACLPPDEQLKAAVDLAQAN